MRTRTLPVLALCLLVASIQCPKTHGGNPELVSLEVTPEILELTSPESSDQILVTGKDANGTTIDLTGLATYSIAKPGLATISSNGRVRPQLDGVTSLTVQWGSLKAEATVKVTGVQTPAPVSFRDAVVPILSKSGCNSGGCHGKAEGQNGFKLSVFGFDPATDYDAIARDGRGRRVFPADPDNSLFLEKAIGKVPHGGGRRVEPDSGWYRLLRRWISEGMVFDDEVADPVTSVFVQPTDVVLSNKGTQQLRVVAVTQSGQKHSVTSESDFQSNNDVVAVVNRDGLVQATEVPGEAAILIRYMGHVAVCRITLPGTGAPFVRPAESNFIDGLVWDKLQKLRIAPGERAGDAAFLRRVSLDTIGTLPTAAEARSFLANSAPEKRHQLIESLLERPEYADYWTQRWADMLQADKDIITPQGTVSMSRWVHQQIADNVPYDRFVSTVLTAQGSTLGHSPAAFFQVQADPEKAARAVSQLFLGVRIECAQCHHHPFERWDQHDYFAFAGFFTGIDRKPGPNGSVKIVNKPGEDLRHPRTQVTVATAALGAATAQFPTPRARREVLAAWLASSSNPLFVRTIVNRLVAHYFGRGLVEPVDDLRATNPASNEPLMQALCDHMVAVNFDVKAFTRTLLNSQVYQLSSAVSESNRLDDQNYSHAAVKPLPAEVLLDAVSQATGVHERFNGWPDGYRAIQIWDNKLPSLFLETFGRPVRQTVCACERGVEPSIAQALHLMNSESTTTKLEDRRSRTAQLAESDLSNSSVVEELYLSTLSRWPSPEELQLMETTLADSNNRRQAIEDIFWTLLNTREFVFNH